MRIERNTMNLQTLRVEGNGQGVKISILKGTHYRGIAKIGFADAADIVAELVDFLYGPDARVVVGKNV